MNNKKNLKLNFISLFLICFSSIYSQEALNSGEIHGNFQTDFQYYKKDSLIGAPDVPEKLLMNGFANIIYTNGNFSSGVRYESYLNPMQGFDQRYKGSGITYRYASYNKDGIDVTVGNYYEQFGTGLVFRTYEDRSLGFDNAMDGIRLKVSLINGVVIKGVIGEQRKFFDKGQGIVRGADAEFSLNEIIPSLKENNTKYIFGGSFISKYEKDNDPKLKLPENVAAYAGRANIIGNKLSFLTEYAYKINDPSSTNGQIYKEGQALYMQTSYTQKGLGISVAAKRLDNMDFRSERNASGNILTINYLPALTKQHSYSLAAMYPYATQPNGEVGFMGEIIYNIKKGTMLGGEYGTNLAINFSKANSISKTKINDTTYIGQSGTDGYKSKFFSIGDQKLYQDFNIEVSRKMNKNLKLSLSFVNILYNIAVIQGHPGVNDVKANIEIADILYKFNEKNNIRFELQNLNTKEDEQDWFLGLAEYNFAGKWFLAAVDQYNYGNKVKDLKIHYYNFSVGYNKNSSRISVSYGKQRAGIVCVGGVCRFLPASDGLSVTLTSSF